MLGKRHSLSEDLHSFKTSPIKSIKKPEYSTSSSLGTRRAPVSPPNKQEKPQFKQCAKCLKWRKTN